MTCPPTLHVTGFANRKAHGPGPLLHIMASPPPYVLNHTAGRVPCLRPQGAEQDHMRALLARRKRAEIIPADDPTLFAYRDAYMARLREAARLAAGVRHIPGLPSWPVYIDHRDNPPAGLALPDGATLVCTCAVSEAKAGRCHRVWAAAVLAEHGFRVVLDGVTIEKATP